MRWRDQRRLHRRAAGRVDRQRHRLGAALARRRGRAAAPWSRSTGRASRTGRPTRSRRRDEPPARPARGGSDPSTIATWPALSRRAARSPAQRRDAGSPRPPRCSRLPADAARAAAIARPTACARRARTSTRAAGGRRLMVSAPQPRRTRWAAISSSRSLRWIRVRVPAGFERAGRDLQPAPQVGAGFDGRQRLARVGRRVGRRGRQVGRVGDHLARTGRASAGRGRARSWTRVRTRSSKPLRVTLRSASSASAGCSSTPMIVQSGTRFARQSPTAPTPAPRSSTRSPGRRMDGRRQQHGVDGHAVAPTRLQQANAAAQQGVFGQGGFHARGLA